MFSGTSSVGNEAVVVMLVFCLSYHLYYVQLKSKFPRIIQSVLRHTEKNAFLFSSLVCMKAQR